MPTPADMKKISAVTFDLWDTLIKEHPGGSEKVAELRMERIERLLTDRGIPHSQEAVRKAYDETGAFLALTWSKKRDMALRDQVLFMLSSIDAKLAGRLRPTDFEEIERVYAEGILDHPPRLLPGAAEALESVKSAGYKIGLVSNTGRTPGTVLRTIMEDMDILDFFDVTVFSNEILVRKPAEKAFRVALEGLKVVPRASVHVGDDPEKDIQGAKSCGMKAIQILVDDHESSESADGRLVDIRGVALEIAKL